MTVKERLLLSIAEKKLYEFGIEIKSGDSYKMADEVILDMIKKWETMSDIQKQSVKNMLLNF